MAGTSGFYRDEIVEDWTRPIEWLSIPNYGVNEEVIYILNAVWDTTSNPCAFLFDGTGAGYTVDWGDGTITNHAMNTTAEKNYVYSDLIGTPFRGYRQALIKITPQAGAVINSVNLCRRHSSFGYSYITGFLDIVVNLANQTAIQPFTDSTLVIHGNVESVYYKKHNSNSMYRMFWRFTSLQNINVFDTSHVTSIEEAFVRCGIRVVPEFDFSNVLNAVSAFERTENLKKVKSSDFKKVTNAFIMFAYSGIEDLSNIQFRDVTNIHLIMYVDYPYGGNVKYYPDFSLCNNIVGDVNYTFAFNDMTIFPYINLAGVTLMSNIFIFLAQRTMRRSLLVGATRSHSYANQLLDATALNEIFTNLGTAAGAQNITITGNPGAGTCDQTIATAKGWIVIN